MAVSPSLVRKLHALRGRIRTALEAKNSGGVVYKFDASDTLEWFQRWAKLRDELIATDPELADLPVRPLPVPMTESNGPRILRPDLHRLWRDTEDAWDVLSHPSRQLPQVSLDREGIFVAGQPFDAMTAVISILRSATASLVIIDGYISERTLDLLTVKDNAVSAQILTRTNSNTPALRQHATAFQSQYGNLAIKTSARFHDRFLIVDNTDCYHFGTSIKDAAIRNTFMFSRIEEPTVLMTLKHEFTTEWGCGAVVPF